jgi:hypothetical protein
MPSLKDAANARAAKKGKLTSSAKSAAKKVADKIGGKSKAPAKTPAKTPAKSSPSPSSSLAPTTQNSSAVAAVAVPGLEEFTPDQIASHLPSFDLNSYNIADPLNPPESLPQVSQINFDKNEAIYEGGIRALKLSGLAFDLTREKFTVVGKRAKAFGAGIKAATAVEAVKGDYLDYLNQTETTAQKSTTLATSQYKTTTDASKAVHTQDEMDQALKQAEIAANLAREKTQEKQSSLDQFRKQLGELSVAK